MNLLEYWVGRVTIYCMRLARQANEARLCERYGFVNVRLGMTSVIGDVQIGEYTSLRGGEVRGGPNSKVIIGRFCNIGPNVMISSQTHQTEDQRNPLPKEGDVVIGDNVWIGSNVVITPGRKIGDRAVIGANSVVTHDVPERTVVGGVPAHQISRLSSELAIHKGWSEDLKPRTQSTGGVSGR